MYTFCAYITFYDDRRCDDEIMACINRNMVVKLRVSRKADECINQTIFHFQNKEESIQNHNKIKKGNMFCCRSYKYIKIYCMNDSLDTFSQ